MPAPVRGWLRAVRAGAPTLTTRAVVVAEARAPARAFALTLSTPRPPGPAGPPTGVDYLTVIALTVITERHRRHLRRRLRLADPSGAVTALRGWAPVNLITGGRLLTSTAPG